MKNEIRKSVDAGSPAGGEIGGCAEFGDDGGAGDAIAGVEKCAIVESGAAPAAVFEDAVRGNVGMARIGFAESVAGDARFGRTGDGLHAECHDFDGARGVSVAIRLGVEFVKASNGIGGPVDAEFEALAAIAKVGGAGKDWLDAFDGACGARFIFEGAEVRCNLWGAGSEHDGAGELAAQIGVEDSERGKRP